MIQLADVSDVRKIHHLVNSAYRGETSRKGWTTEADLFDAPRITVPEVQRLFADSAQRVFKFLENDQIEGCVALRKDGNKLYLGMLTVNPLLQNKGIGKQLLKAAESEAVSEKCSAIYMTVITRRNDLLLWYHRHGYFDTGRRVPFHKEDSRNNTSKFEIELAVLEKNMAI